MQDHSSKKNTPPASPEGSGLKRRGMLFGLGAAGALAAVATTAVVRSGPQVAVAAPQPAVQPPKPEKGGGYHLSQHVLRYYETTKV